MVARKTVCLRRLGGNRSGELQAGRFFANPRVTAAKIVEGWSLRTGAALFGRHVLAIQDTTEVKFPTTAQRRRGLGPVKKGNAYGVVAHAEPAPAKAGDRCGRCQPRLLRPCGGRRSHPRRCCDRASPGSSAVGAGIAALGGNSGAGQESAGVGGNSLPLRRRGVTVVADRESDIYPAWA